MSKLVLFLPDGTTRDIALRRERTAIGRRADNDICLPNLAVSGEHAVVVTILTDSFLEDLGSTNGTLVNGQAIAKHFLRDRDQIEIGRHRLIYCAEDDAVIEPEIVAPAMRLGAHAPGEAAEPVKSFLRRNAEAGPSRATDPAPAPGAQLASPFTPAIRVLTGLSAGASVLLVKAETTIGRPGMQVAAIAKAGNAFLIKRIEGEAPLVNGSTLVAEAAELAHGDQIDIAGTKLEFVLPEQPKGELAASGNGSDDPAQS